MEKDRLFTRSYCCILAANFLLYFAFWSIVPVLPFYLTEIYSVEKSVMGLILSVYTVSGLCMRPFSGYLLDSFARKPLYLLAYFIFTLIFLGYVWAGTLFLFILCRVVHGLAFGMVTVGGNTLVIDIMPSSRRGEGLGYFGLTNNMAMSIGPMFGLFLHGSGMPFDMIFLCALASGLIGLTVACLVKTRLRAPVKRPPLSLDRFILLKGIPAGIALLLLSIPYGMTTNFVAMYAGQIGIPVNTGFFFTLMAVGMAISRIFAGRLVDKGWITQVISWGFYLVIAAFFLLSFCSNLMLWNAGVATCCFFAVPFMLGVGFGVMFPAYNTLFVSLAPNNQRATATSTYLTSWDVGIGIGLFAGGWIAGVSSFDKAYLVGAVLTVVSMFYFNFYVTPHFGRHKVK